MKTKLTISIALILAGEYLLKHSDNESVSLIGTGILCLGVIGVLIVIINDHKTQP